MIISSSTNGCISVLRNAPFFNELIKNVYVFIRKEETRSSNLIISNSTIGLFCCSRWEYNVKHNVLITSGGCLEKWDNVRGHTN